MQNQGLPKTLDELRAHNWLAPNWRDPQVVFYERAVAKVSAENKREINLQAFLECNSMLALIGAVREGLGIALLPEIGASRMVSEGKLIHVLPNLYGREWPFYLVHAFQDEKPVHITRFYTLVRHYFLKSNVELV